MLDRLGLRLRVAVFFAALGLGGAALFVGALWVGWSRAGGPIEGYVTAAIIGAFALLGLAAWVGFLFDENVARPVLSIASDLKTRAASEVEADIDRGPGKYLGSLAPAAQSIHDALAQARRAHAASVADQTALIAREKALLEVLVRDLSQAVLVISPDYRVMLFNQAAVSLFGPIGLDRPVARYLDVAPLEQHISSPSAATPLLTSARGHGALISGTVSDFAADGALLGHVLVLEDATARLAQQSATDTAINQLLDRVRRPAMTIGALLDVAEARPEAGPGAGLDTPRVRAELATLSGALAQVASETQTRLADDWPKQHTTVAEILKARSPITPTSQEPVRCDVFFYAHLVERLYSNIAASGERHSAQWSIADGAQEGALELHLSWEGASFPQTQLDDLLATPLIAAYGHHTVADILAAHRCDMWLDGRSALVLELPRDRSERAQPGPGTTTFFNFDQPKGGGALKDLSFVVFDTETTGLDTARDDVVQLAGVRVLNGAILAGDEMDALVNPGRPIPPASTTIHGITDAMIQNAPHFADVGQEFAAFADDSVLVAHNAAFDRAFLDRLPKAGGPMIKNDMLCTARLSLALHPHLNDHTLDALADRYGVTLKDRDRHTALGDARATAEIFLKMLPVLSDHNVKTLPAALEFQRLP